MVPILSTHACYKSDGHDLHQARLIIIDCSIAVFKPVVTKVMTIHTRLLRNRRIKGWVITNQMKGTGGAKPSTITAINEQATSVFVPDN